MKIDFHTHIFPESVASRAIPHLAAKCGGEPFASGTLTGLLASMDENEIDISVFLQIATNENQMQKINDFAINVMNDNPNKVIAFGSVFPFSEEAVGELKRIHAAGICGIKLHPEYQNFEVIDPRLFPVYEFCQNANMTIVFHAGIDPAYRERLNASPKALREVALAFPDLKIVCAHLGAMFLWDEVPKHLCGLKNVWFDTACVGRFVTKEQFLKIYQSHFKENFLFATDSPWSSPKIESDFIESCGLSADEIEAIYSKNAIDLLHKSGYNLI